MPNYGRFLMLQNSIMEVWLKGDVSIFLVPSHLFKPISTSTYEKIILFYPPHKWNCSLALIPDLVRNVTSRRRRCETTLQSRLKKMARLLTYPTREELKACWELCRLAGLSDAEASSNYNRADFTIILGFG